MILTYWFKEKMTYLLPMVEFEISSKTCNFDNLCPSLGTFSASLDLKTSNEMANRQVYFFNTL